MKFQYHVTVEVYLSGHTSLKTRKSNYITQIDRCDVIAGEEPGEAATIAEKIIAERHPDALDTKVSMVMTHGKEAARHRLWKTITDIEKTIS